MIICEGKYGEATIAADFVESSAMNQINELLNTPVAENAHIPVSCLTYTLALAALLVRL